MTRVLTLVEGADPVPVDLSASTVDAIRLRAARLQRQLRLTDSPVSCTDGTMAVKNVVGTFAMPGVAIDSVPRVLAAVPRWRTALMTMVARGEGLDWEPWLETSDHGETLADHLAFVVANALEASHSLGLPRSYVERGGEDTSLRGRIDASQIWRYAINHSAIRYHFTEYSIDHEAPRALAWVAQRLADAVSQSWLAGQLRDEAEGLPGAEAPDPARPLEVDAAFGHLSEAIQVANILTRCHVNSSVAWFQPGVLSRFHRQLARDAGRAIEQLPELDYAMLGEADGYGKLVNSVKAAPPVSPALHSVAG